jgi:hypothetical protein
MAPQLAAAPPRRAAGHQASTAGWQAATADTLLLRINPVAGRRLATPELRHLLGRLAGTQRHKERLRQAACAELYDLAGRLEGKQRHQVLTLKRAIYNDRDPGAAAAARLWPATVAAWLDEDRAARQAQAAIRAGYPGFVAAERAALTDAIGDEALQLGLAMNAPQALDAVLRYRGRAGRPLPRERKSERGIVQYLTRAMVRTSPMSWFTAVGFAVWDTGGTPLHAPAFDRRAARSAVTVDRVLFSGLVTGMTGPAAGTVAPVLTRNPTLRPDGTGVRFQRRIGDQVQLVETPMTRTLRTLLVLTSLGPLPTADLAEQTAARLGTGRQTGADVVAAAAAAQILVPGPAIDEQAADPLPLARAALGPDHPGSALLGAAEREIAAIATDRVGKRRAALARLQAIGDRLNDHTSRPARLHVNEDVLVPASRVTDRGYQAALHDLANVVELAAAFDQHLVIRRLLVHAFTERFGPGGRAGLVDCGDHLATVVGARARRLTSATADGGSPADEIIRQLLAVRAHARALLAGLVTAGRDEEEVWLPSAELSALTVALPGQLRSRSASYGVLVQPAGGRLVINGCYGGHNLLGMRFLGPAEAASDPPPGSPGAPDGLDVAGRVARRVQRLFGEDGTRLLEDRGIHGSNVNHRAALLPGTLTPQRWLGIQLRHDPDRDELTLADVDGTPVRPLYFGMRWVETLPPPLRIAMWLADTSQVAFDPIGWARRAGRAASGRAASGQGPGEPTSRYPRVVAGDVVIARRRWYPGQDFADQLGTADEAARLAAITRWRAAHGVPGEVVFKTVPEPRSDIDPAAALAWYQRTRRRGKPQYADLTSALMVRVLPRLLERRDRGFAEEALPGVRDGGHAFEWVIEFDRPPGGCFRAARPAPHAD